MNPAKLIEIIALTDLALIWFGMLPRLRIYLQWHAAVKWLAIYLFTVGVIEILAKLYVYDLLKGSNLYLLHIYTMAEFAFLSLMYLQIFNLWRSKTLKWYLVVAFTSVVTYSFFSLVENSSSPQKFQLYSKLLVNGTMVALAVAFFIQSLRNPARYFKHFHALAYMNSGVLLYFAGSFIIYLILNQMINADLADSIYLWLINVVLTLIFHLMCIVALWQKDSRQTKTSPHG